MFACIHGPTPELSEIAADFSPSFEQAGVHTIVFRVDGLQRLHGTLRQIAEAISQRAAGQVNVAIAETVDAAILAAHNFGGITIAPQLDLLPIESLPLTDEMLQTLESWGIYTLQQLAQLPEAGIAARFGAAGVHLQRLARGAVQRPLRVSQPETPYRDRIELDSAVSLLEPLLFLIARILNEQCEKLQTHGMSANEITLCLELEGRAEHIRTLRLPVPMRESKSLQKLLQLDLESHPPPAPTLALWLNLKAVNPRTVQNGIFTPATPAPDKLELTLARIRGIVGEHNVGIPELLDTHHPHPFRLVAQQPQVSNSVTAQTARQALRYFRPPVRAVVQLQNHRPIQISAAGINGKILRAAGPWRTSGDWWTNTPWNRDEWDITLHTGALYRIYLDPPRQWFIEGTYD